MNQLLNRNEVDVTLTWDLTSLFESKEKMLEVLEETITLGNSLQKSFQGKLNDVQTIVACLNEWIIVLKNADQIATYVSLNLSTDQTNSEATMLNAQVSSSLAKLFGQLTFIESELAKADDKLLHEVIAKSKEYKSFIEDVMRHKAHRLHPEVEATLSLLSPVLDAFYPIYNQSKLADLKFKNFEANNKEHALSFVLFENELEFETDHDVRHNAFLSFSHQLSQYQHTMAATYQAHIEKEKILADARKFDSVFDALLFDQKVNKDMYNRQIDIIMEELSPVMQKYARLIKDIYKLDTMTFADLKLPIDPDFEPHISVEQAKETILEGLAPLGKQYTDMVNQAFDHRWIDFVQNTGKSTGAFCSSPYGAHPYILINWTTRMRECFVLAHELGHAGHFFNTHQHQNILDSNPSLYFIEAPSTMNELLVAQSLKNKSSDLRMKRWILATMISRTYYHNFVTHLLEAAYQREVYKIIDAGGSVVASTLSDITLDVIKRFWGDAVEVQDEAKYTWMRQPHYYMGLYSYTYSAGLTLATAASKLIQEDPSMIEQWKKALQAGGTLTPLELGKLVNIDLSTDKPLKDTIKTINDMIDEMIELTKQINSLR